MADDKVIEVARERITTISGIRKRWTGNSDYCLRLDVELLALNLLLNKLTA